MLTLTRREPHASNTTHRVDYIKIFEQIDARLCFLKEEYPLPQTLELQDLFAELKTRLLKDALETQDALVEVRKLANKTITAIPSTGLATPSISYAAAVRETAAEGKRTPTRADCEVRIRCPSGSESL